ncbi:MAG: flavodoxin [Actinobacteria bacterium]|nr:MAG: flavodoxin [Actinomycetota bacterium]
MTILVTAGSKHGATAEMAQRIGSVIAGRGIEVDVRSPAAIDSVDGYNGFVIGSAVYAGHWTKDVMGFIDRFGSALGSRPVWLFSSGPIGDPPKPDEEPVDVAEITIETMARQHRVFAGCLDKAKLSFGERAIVTAFRAPYGDFRDWAAIEAWGGRRSPTR